MEYLYSLANDTVNGVIECRQMHNEILSSNITSALKSVGLKGDIVKIIFESSLQSTEQVTLTGVVNAHQGDLLNPYKVIINNAMTYFNDIMIEYAAENITMGITYYNKTKDVSDYLANVLRYGQSGSLYEVMHEIDALILAGIPVGLSPFVTQARLETFRNKVQNYLNG